MKFIKLTIENFFRVRHMTVSLDPNGVTLIEGENRDTGQSNESGKSTIFEALCWGLFGRYSAGGARAGDEVVNPQVGKDCRVTVCLENGDFTTWFERGRKVNGKNNYLKIMSKANGTKVGAVAEFDMSRKNVSASTMAVNEILGMDYDTFVRGHYFPQAGVLPFGLMTDGEMKQFFIEKFLNIGWVDGCLDRAKNKKKGIEVEVLQLHSRIAQAQAKIEIHRNTIRQCQERFKEWVDDQAKRLRDVQDVIKQIAQEDKALNKQLKDAKAKLKKTKKPKDYDKQLESACTQRDYAAEHTRKAEHIVNRMEYQVQITSKEVTHLTDQIGKVRARIGDRCEVCGTNITNKHMGFMTCALEEKHLECKKSLNKFNEQLKEAKIDVARYQQEYNKAQVLFDDLQQKVSNSGTEYTQAEHEVKILEGKIDGVKRLLDSANNKKEVILGEKDPYTDQIQQHEDDIVDLLENIKFVEGQHSQLIDQIERVEFWIEGFSQKGIQSYLLDSITPTLNQRVNFYLKDLSDNRIRAEFQTVTKNKSGEWTDKFKLIVRNIDGGDTYTSLSGGAKRRVDLACSLAVSDIKRSMSQKPLELFVFDECTEFLDGFWVERFLDSIKRNFGQYSTFVISHRQLNGAYFDHVLRVVKENGESKIE